MSKSVDIEKIKKNLSIFADVVRRKFVYLIDCINRFGMSGITWWFKTQSQKDDLDLALQDLRSKLACQDASLLLVEKMLSDFILPEDDLGHIYWYTDAHNKLINVEKNIDKKKVTDIKLMQLASKELKYISESNEFHRIYQLENIQQKVKDMYKELQQKISQQQSLEKQQMETEKQKHVTNLAKADADKAAAIAKSKMIDAVKIKEKRLAIIEDKKRQLVEKKTLELKIKEQNELAEIKAKQAEIERQEKLQESYRELEMKEKIKGLPLEELIEMVNKKIENKKILTFIQLDQLSKLKHTIEGKKA